MLQLDHDAELLLEIRSKLLIHRLLQALYSHRLNLAIVIRILAFQHLTIVTLSTSKAIQYDSISSESECVRLM